MQQPRPSPLALILNPPGPQQSTPGNTVELFVTVSNQGTQSAVIDVFIDETSRDLRQWCDAPRQRIALDPQQSTELAFRFQIPVQAFPGTYEYVLVVDAPQHYPEDTPIQRPRQLTLLPAVGGQRLQDPTFDLKPRTSALAPLVLKKGQSQPVQITVNNRSNRVDRFRLICPDLEDNWYTVRYTAPSLNGPGIVESADGLDLNPGTQGTITLTFQPPPDTLAGSYSPTVQVYSANTPDLSLLDLVYLQIPALHDLQADLEVLLSKVSRSAGRYAVKLTNTGNVVRELKVGARTRDEVENCEYACDPEKVRLLPGKSTAVELSVKPTNGWLRPFWGGPALFNFQVELEDLRQLPLPKELPRGVLEWLPRPIWQLLLLILAGLALLAGLVYVIYLIYFRPPELPAVTAFKPDSLSYSEDAGDVIRLMIGVANADRLQQIELLSYTGENAPADEPAYYNFTRPADPGRLAAACTMQSDRSLSCTYNTGLRKGGIYRFVLRLRPQGSREIITARTEPEDVRIKPKQQKIVQIAPPKIAYFTLNGKRAPARVSLKIKTVKDPGDKLVLKWEVRGKNVRVEVPPYGNFPPVYTLTLDPYTQVAKETITLRASNKSVAGADQEVSLGFNVEAYDPTPPPPPASVPSGATAPAAPAAAAKKPAAQPKKPVAPAAKPAPPPAEPLLKPALPTR